MNTSSMKINYVAVLITGIVAFILSGIWYSPAVFGPIWMKYRTIAPPDFPEWTMAFAPLRELIASYVIALLIVRISITSVRSSINFILLLWLAFHAVGMAGAILWDHVAWQLGAVHAGDWLMKMIFMTVVLTLWHNKKIVSQISGIH